MNTPNGGGPAFPAHDLIEGICNESFHGMTLRDYFAAAAMASLVSSFPDDLKWRTHVAVQSYAIADALLSERTKQGK